MKLCRGWLVSTDCCLWVRKKENCMTASYANLVCNIIFLFFSCLVTNVTVRYFWHCSHSRWRSMKALSLQLVLQVGIRINHLYSWFSAEASASEILLDKVCSCVVCFSLTLYVSWRPCTTNAEYGICFYSRKSKEVWRLCKSKKYEGSAKVLEPIDHHNRASILIG